MQRSRTYIFLAVFLLAILISLTLWFFAGREERMPYISQPHGQPGLLFVEPVQAQATETTADALSIWRDYRDAKPTLLIFSNKPIMPVPQEVRDEVSELLAVAGVDEVRERTARPAVPDTLLRPEMAVAAGLEEGYFSRVIWVVSVEEGSELQLEGFVQQLRRRAELWGEYLDTFHLEEGRIVGTLAGTPVDVITLAQLPPVTEPLLLHLDTSYLLPDYKGEIKTPVYNFLRGLSEKIATMNYKVWAASVSRDNLTGEMPLDTRFFADIMVSFMAQPDQRTIISEEEQLRTEALYLVNFFRNEMIYDDYQKLKELRPQDPSVYFGEYKVLRDLHQPDLALKALEQAVALDAVYAYEYGALVDMAMEKQLPDKAFDLLDRAIAALPNEPFLKLRKAKLLLSVGRDDDARDVLRELRDLPWSPQYYTGVRTEIERLF